MAKQIKVLFLSPEAVPFAKTGGLADVAGALPDALKRLGVDVRLILPHYREVWTSNSKLYLLFEDLKVPFGKDLFTARVWESQTDGGTPVYFIKREDMFDRPNLYGNAYGDYYDNLERFSFFCHAALCLADRISFSPDVLHCHDWQSGLVPAFIKGPYARNSAVGQAKTIFTIHNLGYQGIFPQEKLSITGLPKETFYQTDGLEFWGNISLLKSGIFYSDSITTVSPSYALEIQTDEYGLGMAGILQKRRASLYGILNGVDYKVWNPACDTHLKAQYTPENISGKNHCKESLIKEMKLIQSLKSKPLLGMISRLDTQKGLDLLVKILDDILALDVGLVVLGSGDQSIQEILKKAAKKNPRHFGLTIGFDESLAHRIMAGADMFLIPSRYEPCGLTQMYALKYGTIPIVRNTGGLKDSIREFNLKTGKGNGFKFSDYKSEAFLASVQRAIKQFHNTEGWKKLRVNAMKEDFSWDRSAKSYLKLYRSTLKGK